MKSKVIIKRVLLSVGIILGCILLFVIGYISYLFLTYNRIEDNQVIDINNNQTNYIEVNKEYKILSYNIGCGIYTDDFGFFMDGGKESKAKSKDVVIKTMNGIKDLIKGENPDLMILQEVDERSTRSHNYDEVSFLKEEFKDYSCSYSVNYHSSYLMYPLFDHFGVTNSGIMTFGKFFMEDCLRRSLPIETSIMKFFDLDRCYTKTIIPLSSAEGAKQLVLFNLHLSAYTSDGVIANEQVKMLVEAMNKESSLGNYVICGGDFNKDLLGDSSKYFGISTEGYTWTQPLDTDVLKDTTLKLIAPLDETNPIPSVRNADGPYNDKQLVLTIDGFIVSNNVEVVNCQVIDNKFAYSDHNPITMTFKLID